jgi:hypothetical protein
VFILLSTLLPTFSIPVSDYYSPVCCVSFFVPSFLHLVSLLAIILLLYAVFLLLSTLPTFSIIAIILHL